jgi:hypothetical protein
MYLIWAIFSINKFYLYNRIYNIASGENYMNEQTRTIWWGVVALFLFIAILYTNNLESKQVLPSPNPSPEMKNVPPLEEKTPKKSVVKEDTEAIPELSPNANPSQPQRRQIRQSPQKKLRWPNRQPQGNCGPRGCSPGGCPQGPSSGGCGPGGCGPGNYPSGSPNPTSPNEDALPLPDDNTAPFDPELR